MKKISTLLVFILLLLYGNAQKQLILCTTGRGLDRNSSIGIDNDMWTYIQKWVNLTYNGQDAGVTAVRLHIEWSQYEPTPGNYQGAKLVAALQAIKNLKPGMKLALHFSYLRPGRLNDSYLADEDIARLADGNKVQDDIAHTVPSVYSATARGRFIDFVNDAMASVSAFYNDILYVQMGNSEAEEFIIPIVYKNGYHHSGYYEDKALAAWRNEYLPCRYPGPTVTWGSNTYNLSSAPPFDPGEYGDYNSEHGREYHRFASWGLMRLYKQFRDAVKSHSSNIKVLYFIPGFGTGQGNLRSMHTATIPAAHAEFDGTYTSEGNNTGDTWRKIMAVDVLKGTNPDKIAAIEWDPTDLGQQPGGIHGIWPNIASEWFPRAFKHGADYIHFAMHYWPDEVDQLAPALAAIKATYVTPNYQSSARQTAVTKNIFPDVFTGAFIFDDIWNAQGGSVWSSTDNNPVSINMSDAGYWENVNSCAPVSPCEYTISGSGPGTVSTSASVTLSSTCSGQCSGISYSWSGAGISGSNTSASVTFNAPSSAGTYTYTLTTSKSGCNDKTTTVSLTVTSTGGGGSYTQEFDNFFTGRLGSAYDNHVTAIVGCAQNDLYTYNHGFSPTQKLEVMSLSKWTTAAIIMMLVKENKLALNDKVGDYIPSWSTNGKQDVTIRHLLAHNSGVPDPTPFDERTDMDLEQAVDNIALIPLQFTPGQQFHYGSSSYKVVARVAEVVENKRWKVIFAERLGAVMPTASYPNNPPHYDNNPSPGYGLQVSLNEYANFMRMILRYGKFNGATIMDSASIAIMEQQHNVDGGFDNYGLGLFRDSDNTGVKQVWHPGASGCFTWINREKKFFGVILSANGGLAWSASRDFKDAYAAALLPSDICANSTPQPCDYSVSLSGPSTVNTGASVTLNSNCSGQCSGLSYSWSGTGISGSNTSASVSFTAPSAAGTYTYTLVTSKAGCTNQTQTIQLVVTGGDNPCGLVDKATIGTWNGLSVQARQFTVNGNATWLIVTAVSGSPVDKHFPRGANFAARTDINWTNGPVSPSCFGGGETGWSGLGKPSGISTPSGYALGTEPDGAEYFYVNCTAPSAPGLSASASTIVIGANTQVTLSATGCSGGVITWSNGLGTGTSKTVSPTATTTYTATCAVGGCTSSAASVTVTVTPGSFNQCLESESSSGNGAITDDPNASNGYTRGEEGNNNHYVDYEVTGVPVAGTYYLTLRYYSSSAPTISVKVNAQTAQTYNVPNSGSWNVVWANYQVAVNLLAGNNTIRIAGVSGGSCRQDRVCVSNSSGSSALLAPSDEESVRTEKLVITPNPGRGLFYVNFYLETGKKATLMVSDMQGKILHRQPIVGSGSHRQQVDLGNKTSGVYVVQLIRDGHLQVGKVTIVQ